VASRPTRALNHCRLLSISDIKRDGGATDLAGQLHQVVKRDLGRRVEQPQPLERVDAVRLVLRHRRQRIYPRLPSEDNDEAALAVVAFVLVFVVAVVSMVCPRGVCAGVCRQRDLLVQRRNHAIQRPIWRRKQPAARRVPLALTRALLARMSRTRRTARLQSHARRLYA
jgi:hypothetical protein